MAAAHPKTCVYQAANAVEGNLIRGLLESEGISVELRGEALGGAYPGVPRVSETRVYVATRHQEAARTIIERYEQDAAARGVWHCGSCGEHNSAAFEICWQCGSADPTAA